jgi:hypothetical protein
LFVYFRELLLNNNFLRVLPYELGKLFKLQVLGLKGNPLTKEIMSLYMEPNGTHKLLTYMMDNLQGRTKKLFCMRDLSLFCRPSINQSIRRANSIVIARPQQVALVEASIHRWQTDAIILHLAA